MFEWDQTLDEVNIYINLPPDVHSKQFYCNIQSKHLQLGIKGNPPYLNVILSIFHFSFFCSLFSILFYFNLFCLMSQHDLTSPVKTDSSFWTIGKCLYFPYFFVFLALIRDGNPYPSSWVPAKKYPMGTVYIHFMGESKPG